MSSYTSSQSLIASIRGADGLRQPQVSCNIPSDLLHMRTFSLQHDMPCQLLVVWGCTVPSNQQAAGYHPET